MKCVSADGTPVAFTRAGTGRPLILIDGALCHRGVGPNRALAARLSDGFTVVTYDRRGRGESGDSAHYAVEREIEDIAALIDAVGGRVCLYGISSGGMLALEAATRLEGKVDRVAVYEIPFVVDDSRPPVSESFRVRLEELLAAGHRGAAVKSFMREAVRLPPALVAAMPLFPGWSKNKQIAHTLLYDVAIMGETQSGRPLPSERWTSITAPTLVASGGKSPAWVRHGAVHLAEVLPNTVYRTLDGQRHYVKANALAPMLSGFIAGTLEPSAVTDGPPHLAGGSTAGG